MCEITDTVIISKNEFTKDDDPKYTNLCIEGGGSVGISYIGALQKLHSMGILGGMQNFAGSSVGAIVAAALACGASFNFLYQELSSLDLNCLLDYGNRFRAVYNLYYYYGFCHGDALMAWFESFIEKLTGDKDITLGGVHEKFGGRLVITGTKLGPSGDKESCVYFDYVSYPNLMLKTALRISTSIPVIFMPVYYDGSYWVDGGTLDNYPIKAFHHNTPNDDRINPKTLGLMLITEKDTGENLPKIRDIYTFTYSLISCYLNQTQKIYMDPQDWKRTIKIQCGGASSLNFNLSAGDKKKLIDQGYQAVERWCVTLE